MYTIKSRWLKISLLLCFAFSYLFGQMETAQVKKLKVEFQYSDYFEYKYPQPILYHYPDTEYEQKEPYFADFPEHRSLIRYSQSLGNKGIGEIKYQYSKLKENAEQYISQIKYIYQINENIIPSIEFKVTNDTRDFDAYQIAINSIFHPNEYLTLTPNLLLYTKNSENEEEDVNSATLELEAKYLLTSTIAIQPKYSFYQAKDEFSKPHSHTFNIFISKYLPTQTALHLCYRYYENSDNISSNCPSMIISQYIDWRTVVTAKYRYYWNNLPKSSITTENNLPEFTSQAISIQLKREITYDLGLNCKYRYYQSDSGIKMNTYLINLTYNF